MRLLEILIREKSSEIFLIINNEIKKFDQNSLFKKLGVTCEIRFHKEDFKNIDLNLKLLTHFNLEHSNHKIGNKYALVLIEKPGYFDGEKEIKPILNFEDSIICECVDTKNFVQYENIPENYFDYSLKNIKNVDELKKAILRRYKNSMKHIDDEKKLSLGVGITNLKIIKKIDLNHEIVNWF